jgi:replicative DNA helicase
VIPVRSDRGAEQALLAACMESKTARQEARRHIASNDFDDPRHEAVWDAMSRLDRHGKTVTPTTLSAIVGVELTKAVLIDLVTTVGYPDAVPDYAAIIRGWSMRRRIEHEAHKVLRDVMNPDTHISGFAAGVASRFAAIRDSSGAADDITGMTVSELLAQHDEAPEWLIPNLLERRDRLMLTGEEGLGKSHLLRQFAILAAAGLDPLTIDPIEPIRATIIDCENTWSQVRRRIRSTVEFAARQGSDPSDRVVVDCTSRMDITRDKDISRIHQLLDATQADLVVIGPLYRLVPRALQTDDDTAPVLAALDTIRDRGCALLIEAHAGHALGKGGVRDLRPRGSSSLLGWPEFGYGMRGIGTEGYADLVQWRGPREDREWPARIRRTQDSSARWTPHHDLYGWNEGGQTA